MRCDLKADTVRELFDYEPTTGRLFWNLTLKRPGHFKGEAGTVNGAGYRQVQVNKKLYLVHRIIWLHVYSEWPREFIDHANGDRTDNRINNLREATRTENCRNKAIPSNNSTGFKGVHIRADGHIQASIGIGRRQKFLGYFASLEMASRAYEQAAAEQFGRFSRGSARQILKGEVR